jgi:alpha-glucosidase
MHKIDNSIPLSVITHPPPPAILYKHKSDLIFNYNPSPFAFRITHQSQPAATPLLDTQGNALPTMPTGPVILNCTSTVLDVFPFVFEKQYLQVSFTSLPVVISAKFYPL